MTRVNRFISYGSALCFMAILFFAVGCSRNVAEQDARESRDPLIRKARAKVGEGDNDAAIKLLIRAAETQPDMARPHLELAVLYDDYKKDYVRAVYHYTRYLELRPDTEKRDMIEKLISDAKISFAADVSPKTLADARIKVLEEENQRLRADLNEARQLLSAAGRKKESAPAARQKTVQSESSVSRPVVAPSISDPEPKPKSVPKVEIYYVRANDTLSTIAAAVYNDASKWKLIYNANRDTIPDSDKLRVGQALIIPK